MKKGSKKSNSASGPFSSSSGLSKTKTKQISTEKHGPTDWTHSGIKIKYRGEVERESTWDTYQRSLEFSSSSNFMNSKGILPETQGGIQLNPSPSTDSFLDTNKQFLFTQTLSSSSNIYQNNSGAHSQGLSNSQNLFTSTNNLSLKTTGNLFQTSNGPQLLMEKTQGKKLQPFKQESNIIPTIKIERHPLYKWLEEVIKKENVDNILRTKSRLLMKRFVFDVQELWMTNIEHLKEYQEKLFQSQVQTQGQSNRRNSTASIGESSTYSEDSVNQNQFQGTKTDNFNRGIGLANRRDTREILNNQFQVQSVSQKRTFLRAYQTANLPHPEVILDYVADTTPVLEDSPSPAPFIQSIISNLTFFACTTEENEEIEEKNSYITKKHFFFKYIGNSITKITHTIGFHIQRLLPSKSFQDPSITDILWRFTILDSNNLNQRVYLAYESKLALFIANHLNQNYEQTDNIAYTDRVVLFNSKFNMIPIKYLQATDSTEDEIPQWEAQVEVSVQVQYDKTKEDSQLKPLRFIFVLNLYPIHPKKEEIEVKKNESDDEEVPISENTPTDSPQPVYSEPLQLILQCSPCEIAATLGLPPPLVLYDLDWWLEKEKKDSIWIPLIHLLRIETDDYLDQNIPHSIQNLPANYKIPRNLIFYEQFNPYVFHLDGSLTLLQAMACSYELLTLLHLYSEEEHDLHTADKKYGSDSCSEPPKLMLLNSSSDLLMEVGIYSCSDLLPTDADRNYSKESLNLNVSDIDLTVRHDSVNWNDIFIKNTFSGQWEKLLENSPCSSILANHLETKLLQVPGASGVGKKGLWFSDSLYPDDEKTHVGAHFYRDPDRSLTDSIMVNLNYSLDTSIFIPIQIAWENFSQLSLSTNLNEENLLKIAPIFSKFLVSNYIKIDYSLDSEINKKNFNLTFDINSTCIEHKLSGTVLIYSNLPVEGIDYPYQQDPENYPEANQVEIYYKNSTQKKKLIRNNRRYLSDRTSSGFRQKLTVCLLKVNPIIEPHVYGITNLGATLNNLGVNNRNIWHNIIALNENINRPRGAKDYFYFLKAPTHWGTNEGNNFIAVMKSYEMVEVISSGFSNYLKEYKRIEVLKNVFDKELSLDEKINNVEIEILSKESANRLQLLTNLQTKLDKKLKKLTKSEIGWKKKYFNSIMLEIQNNWERRKDTKTGMIFFHKVNDNNDPLLEKYSHTCQWEVPPQWDGDIWTNLYVGNTTQNVENRRLLMSQSQASSISDGNEKIPRGDYNAPSGQQAIMDEDPFAEPGATWVPTIESKSEDKDHFSLSDIRGYKRNDEDLNSVMADKSLMEPDAATIDTVNLEHIAEQLVSSDELMRIIAKRLGLPESQVVPADELSSVFSVNSYNQIDKQVFGDNILNAPRTGMPSGNDRINEEERNIPEFDSDDDLWSNDEDEGGNVDEDIELMDAFLPQNQLEDATMKRQINEQIYGDKVTSMNTTAHPKVPYLKELDENSGGNNSTKIMNNLDKFSWRRLPRPDAGLSLLGSSLKPRTRGPELSACNTLNTPIYLLPIAPCDACTYVPEDFSVPIESLYIPDAKKDLERILLTLERNVKNEEILSRNIPTDELLMFSKAKEFTNVDEFLANQYQQDKQTSTTANLRGSAIEKALLAAKSGNIADMEDSLAEDIPINTCDEFGNTLLILAAQQGDKRMFKFLLRRGANINLQNLSGNTCLHYLYAYGKFKLAEYAKSKGADDSILNIDGLTCYEDLSKDSLINQYADFDKKN